MWGGLNQRFVLPPAGKCIFSFLHPCLPARAATLGDRPAAGTAPACATNRAEPNQGAFSAQPSPAAGSHVPAERATLMVWDISWSPHHLLHCEGRSGREVPHHPVCAPLGNRRSRKKALYGHREKQTAFCTAAFQFADVHQLSLQEEGI